MLRPRFSGETATRSKARPVSSARPPRYAKSPSVAPPTRTSKPIKPATFASAISRPGLESLFFGVDYLENLDHVRELENVVYQPVHAEQHQLAFETLGFLQGLDHDRDSGAVDVAYRGEIDGHFGGFFQRLEKLLSEQRRRPQVHIPRDVDNPRVFAGSDGQVHSGPSGPGRSPGGYMVTTMVNKSSLVSNLYMV